jgi:hypothetical protein
MGALFRLRLSDADRERYGCKEWLDVDPFAITNREAAAIQRGFTADGLKVAFDNPALWLKALTGEVVTDENGAPVMDPITGLDGEPTVVPRRRPDFGAELILVWLALRHNGTDVPMSEVDYDMTMRWESIPQDGDAEEDAVPGESEGKDDAGSPSDSETAPISAT